MEQTDSCQRGGERGRGDWMKEGEGLSLRTYTHDHRHRQQCGEGQREVGKGGKTGTSVIVSTLKFFSKKKK